ncbi:hypothetical protein EZS27_041465, partial [termite gut metagenome]
EQASISQKDLAYTADLDRSYIASVESGCRNISIINIERIANAISELNIKKWRLLKSDEKKNIKTRESIGMPIKQIFDICVGIATLKDEIFFVDGSNIDGKFIIKTGHHGKRYKIEKEITRSVYL